ncbi:MAG: 3',5'-cyclic-AMP phosphodiesterase [Porticoccaceae bacterium]
MQNNKASEKTWRLVQITDPHIGPSRDYCLAGVQTYETFRQVLAELGSQKLAPDMIYATGDIAANGAPEAYELFAQQMQFLEIPYGWLPGNHDQLTIMEEGLSSASYWPMLEMGQWRVISLNTSVPGKVGGALAQSELDFLEQVLSAEPDKPVIVFLHHPPLPVGCDWLDRQRIANADELEAIVRASGNVKAVFSGHVHQDFAGQWAGCEVHTAPSTCFQFLPNSPEFALSDQSPGYRWIDLRPDGSIDTGVEFLKETGQVVDHKAVGY